MYLRITEVEDGLTGGAPETDDSTDTDDEAPQATPETTLDDVPTMQQQHSEVEIPVFVW